MGKTLLALAKLIISPCAAKIGRGGLSPRFYCLLTVAVVIPRMRMAATSRLCRQNELHVQRASADPWLCGIAPPNTVNTWSWL
jgi:hypothetical protein